MNRSINRIFLVIVILFAIVSLNLVNIHLISPQKILGRPENLRYILDEAREPRGEIYSSDGELLARSEFDGDLYNREYPFGEIFEPALGFFNTKYGKSGIELALNDYISQEKMPGLIGTLSRIFRGNFSDKPDKIILTIDSQLQKEAFALLSNKKGAIVAMNPKSGEIKALASSPSFDPNNLSQDWDALSKDKNSPFLDRATAGLYAPGSTFKVITASAALESNIGINKSINCNGEIEIFGNTIRDFEGRSHGEVDLNQAFIQSCNLFFASLSTDIGSEILSKYASRFGFGKKIPFELYIQKSELGLSGSSDSVELAWTGIGQGKVLVTPIEMALIASAIANHGEIMTPYLLEKAVSADGRISKQSSPKILYRAVDEDTAETITGLMEKVVEEGTGRVARIAGITSAGKTGTAEVGNGTDPHSWFIGFAPSDDPKITFAIIIENGGAGGTQAAAIFRELVKNYIKKY